MYEVIVRKSLRYHDGTTASEESQEKVNHEHHALNLAAKIARNGVVEWVEIEELRGRFKARASRAPDGTVQESLQSARYKIQRKRSFRPAWKNRVRSVILLCLLGFGALGYLSQAAGSEDLGLAVELLALALLPLIAIWFYVRKRKKRLPG